MMCFLDKMDEADKKRREENKRRHDEIIEKRKEGHLEGYTRTILEVKWEYTGKQPFLEIIVKDCISERAYITRCDNIDETVSIIKNCCYKYNVEQIHVEENGVGADIYNAILKQIDNIDIVPFRYTKMKLWE